MHHACAIAGCSPQEARDQLNAAGLQPPFVAKPLWADGREGAHGLAVLADTNGVDQILRGDAPDGMHGPLLLSQYLDHGGCLFKVLLLMPCSMHKHMHRQRSAQSFSVQPHCITTGALTADLARQEYTCIPALSSDQYSVPYLTILSLCDIMHACMKPARQARHRQHRT